MASQDGTFRVPRPGADARLISNYPSAWTKRYLQSHYERCDPVIIRAFGHPEPFEWGLGVGSSIPSNPQRELFEEAARFGIRYGFTVPIHDDRGSVASSDLRYRRTATAIRALY
jgi:hypothetical protein